MLFSRESLENIQAEYRTVSDKRRRLTERYLTYALKDVRAREHAAHGFLRRLKALARCIENTFRIIPPDRVSLPTSEELTDAEINLQAFIFNVFGCVDNLAWIWVCEKNIPNKNGSSIPHKLVGLGPKNLIVRNSFSVDFQQYLKEFDDWFDNLENYRHAIAHRIPLYIPPHIVQESELQTYQALESQMAAALKQGNVSEYDRLLSEQQALVVFEPFMTHSFGERAKPVAFHAQMLTDFNTVEAIGLGVLDEMDRK